MSDNNRGNTIRYSIPEGMFTKAQVAREVGVSADTILRWCDTGFLPETDTIQVGETSVRVWDEKAVEVARMLAGKTGRLDQRTEKPGVLRKAG